jgi:hypothetical protein
VTLRNDETLQKMVNVTNGVSVEIDGAGRTITLSDFGFHVDDGALCLHDVELTGGRSVPALVVLGEAAVANASHVRISNCMIKLTVDKVLANLLSALDGCNSFKPALDSIRQSKFPGVSWLFSDICSHLDPIVQQCCNTTKDPKADFRVALNIAAGMAVAFRCSPQGSIGSLSRAAANFGACSCATREGAAVHGGESRLRKFGDSSPSRLSTKI